MSGETYSALVREHFSAPRNTPCHGEAPDVVFATAGAQAEGVHYRLSARVRDRHLSDLRFEAFGCPHSIAAASLLTEELRGSSLESAAAWNWRVLSRVLDVPAGKRGRLLILEDALRSLIAAARDLDQAALHPHPSDSPPVHEAT